MIPSNDISKALTLVQKISEQMATLDKISSSIKTTLSLSEKISSITELSKTFTSTPKFYGGAEICSNTYFKNPILVPDHIKDVKFYGGGSWESISSNAFQLPLSNNKYREIDIDLVMSKDNKGGWFSLDLIKSNGLISRLNSIDTIRRVTESNLKDKLKSRDQIVDNISNMLYSLEGSYQCQTKIEANNDRYSFEEYEKFYNSLFHSVSKFIDFEETISFELSKIEILNKLYKSIKAVLKKITLNKRDVFRKINSFHFKNLDDYHSISFAA